MEGPEIRIHEIEFRWKEEVVYWEGDRGFVFEGGWAVDPPDTYVPCADCWDQVVPDWLKGRYDDVVGRLKARSGHVVKDDPYHRTQPGRELRR